MTPTGHVSVTHVRLFGAVGFASVVNIKHIKSANTARVEISIAHAVGCVVRFLNTFKKGGAETKIERKIKNTQTHTNTDRPVQNSIIWIVSCVRAKYPTRPTKVVLRNYRV